MQSTKFILTQLASHHFIWCLESIYVALLTDLDNLWTSQILMVNRNGLPSSCSISDRLHGFHSSQNSAISFCYAINIWHIRGILFPSL